MCILEASRSLSRARSFPPDVVGIPKDHIGMLDVSPKNHGSGSQNIGFEPVLTSIFMFVYNCCRFFHVLGLQQNPVGPTKRTPVIQKDPRGIPSSRSLPGTPPRIP